MPTSHLDASWVVPMHRLMVLLTSNQWLDLGAHGYLSAHQSSSSEFLQMTMINDPLRLYLRTVPRTKYSVRQQKI
jgi:hypothetical protein